MDPVSIILAALVAGAAAGAKPMAEQAIKDAYNGLKSLIQKKYEAVNVVALEEEPDDDLQQAATAASLKRKGAGEDPELLQQAKALRALIEQHDREASIIGVNAARSVDAKIKLKDVTVNQGTGIYVPDARNPNIEAENLTVGGPAPEKDPSSR